MITDMLYYDEEIRAEENDSKEFVEIVNRIISLTIFQFGIDEISLVKINNWFDHKWLNFSGKSVVKFDSGGILKVDAAIQEEWREKITVPPFNPNRVVWEKYVRKRETGNKVFEKSLHRRKISNQNIHNRISNYTDNGLFVWFSAKSKTNKRGSLMVYRVQGDEVGTWYASFEKRDEWRISQSKGIELYELKGLLK